MRPAVLAGFALVGALLALAFARRSSSPAPAAALSSSSSSSFNPVVEVFLKNDSAGAAIASSVELLLAPVAEAAGELLEQFEEVVSGAARKLFTLPARAQQYSESIAAAEQKNGIPESLLGRLLFQESRFRPEVIEGRVRSPAGAVGIAQFMPATAAELGVDPLNASQSIAGAARYLRQLYDKTGDWGQALAAYNWGIGNLQRKGFDRAPAETRAYVSEILADVELGS